MYFNKKNHIGSVHNKDRLQLDKKEKRSKVIKFAIFLKTVNFKVKKAIRYQLKLSKRLFYYLQCSYRRALRLLFIQFLMRLQKEQQIETTNKFQLKLARKQFRSRNAVLCSSKCVRLRIRTLVMWYVTSH